MRSKTTGKFRTLYQSIPKPIQEKAKVAYQLWSDNPDHPSLRFKKFIPSFRFIRFAYATTMAAYNRWMNDRIYAACTALSDEERKRDVGAFFKSVHGTLNHILLGDRVWMGRFTGIPFSVRSLDQELYAEFAELRAERQRTDEDIAAWVNSRPSDDFTDASWHRSWGD